MAINTKQHNIPNIPNIPNILYYVGMISLLIAVCISIPYYVLDYKPSKDYKSNIMTTTCIILNQTYINTYSCYKKFYQCNCNIRFYYPCDILLNQQIQNYCCDPICVSNISLNSLNYILCGFDITFTSIIQNAINITNTFINTCKFDDYNCINYWLNLNKHSFECYYDIRNKDVIMLNEPDYITLKSIGFIFAYIFYSISVLCMILCICYSIYIYIKRSNYREIN